MTEKKRKILMLCDHPLATSGVGTQSRWLINGLLNTNKYTFRVFGGAIKHDDYRTIKVTDDFLIKPTDGFGNPDMLRHVLATERPDCLLLFTDPRFFMWVWAMEDEVHQVCPIAYNHLWDERPWPEFNRVLYESTDLINCINYPTFEMVNEQFPEKTNYIPHAVPTDCFKRVSASEKMQWRKKLVGDVRKDWFLALYVGRNARRKMPNDILVSWKQFLDQLEQKHGHRNGVLIMHTNPLDQEGPNLIQTQEMLGLDNNVVFSKDIVAFNEMNFLYNACDVCVNRSCNEGFGLPILEAKMAEVPVISIMTGGLTRQVKDHETGFEYGVAMPPDTTSLVGNQLVPWINEHFVTHERMADAFMTMHEKTPAEREEIGKLAREHAIKNYNIDTLIRDWDSTLTNLISSWSPKTHQRWRKIEL